jgi:hypothetical protein
MEPELEPEPEPERVAATPAPTSNGLDRAEAESVLTGVLDHLGTAHHRPFSRG